MTDGRVATVVGGVGELYQGDLDVGRRVVEALGKEDLGPSVAVEDMHYGAVAVVQRIEDLAPDALVLVGSVARGRTPGTVRRRRIPPPQLDAATLQVAVGDAVTGYVSLDLIVEVATGLGALPRLVVGVEVEPVHAGPSEHLSPEVDAVLPTVVDLARREAQLAPLHVLVDRLRLLLSDGHLEDAPATRVLGTLLHELRTVEGTDRWGGTFALRDDLRARLGEGAVPEGMDHRDWALAWNLVEELDRRGVADATPPG